MLNLFPFKASGLNSDSEDWAKTIFHQLSQDTCINFVEGSEDDHDVKFDDGNG